MTKIIKSDFIKNLELKFDFTKSSAKDIVEEFFDFISQGLIDDNQVCLTGIGILRNKVLSAGKIQVNNINFENGYKIIEKPERKKVRFSASNVIIRKIN